MRIIVTGADGMLGTDLCRTLASSPDHEVFPLTIQDLDLRDEDRVMAAIREAEPHAVVNTAAMTDVDGCEDQPGLAHEVNALAARNLAVACQAVDACMVHISTDFVFDGEKSRPYKEGDATRPLSVYGRTKLAGEKFVRTYCVRHFIVRTAWLYGAAGPKNFVEWVIRQARGNGPFRVVTDQTGSPTFTLDLCYQIGALLNTRAYGLYHATGEGYCTRHEWATAILENLGMGERSIGAMTSEELNQKARRPMNSGLENARLHREGLCVMRDWQDALSDYLLQREDSALR